MFSLNKMLEIALAGAEEVALLINNLRHDTNVATKGDGTIVTNADIAAESMLRKHFAKHTPGIAVWGEEYGRTSANAQYEWIIDPIDGTTWYAMGSPIFGSLIGLAREGVPVLGVVSFPATGEVVYAAQGSGCYYRSPWLSSAKRLRLTSGVTRLSEAKISASGLHYSDLDPVVDPHSPCYRLKDVAARSALFRMAGDCLQHALLARGKLDAAIDTAMHPWDSAALIPCLLESGSVLSGIEGESENILTCGSLVSANNHNLLQEIIETLNR